MHHANRHALFVALVVGTLTRPAAAAPPVVTIDGTEYQTITFTSPPVYDLTTNESSEQDGVANATLIAQDLKGRIDGIIVDKGGDIELTTNVTGTIKRSGGVTTISEELVGEGSLGDGDTISSRSTKRSEVRELAGGVVLATTFKIKTCTRFRQPFSDKYAKTCSAGGGTHEAPFTRSGDWTIRLTLTQSRPGEIFGTGVISTNVHSPFARATDVVADGKIAGDGTAKIKLAPLFKGGDGPVTMKVEMYADASTELLTIFQVYAVKGKLLGQKLDVPAF